MEGTGDYGPYCESKCSVGTNVVQRGRESVNWIVGEAYRSVYVPGCGAKDRGKV